MRPSSEPIRTVLVVDADADSRAQVHGQLKGLFTVVEAETVQAALRFLADIRPDAVLVDPVLPDGDGLTLGETLSVQGIPCIAWVEASSEGQAIEVLRRGMVDYRRKSEVDEIPGAVDRALEIVAQRRRLGAEQARLETQQRLLPQVLETLPVGVCVLDSSGMVRYLNQHAREILGPQAQDGRPIREVLEPQRLFVRDSDTPYLFSKLPLFQALTGQASAVDDIEVVEAGGERRLVQMAGIPIEDERGIVRQAVATVQDITKQERLQQQIRHARRMESVGQLAGGLAHDFNNLLTVINSCSALALEGLPPKHELRYDLEQILQATQRAERLTKQLLAFSRRQIVRPEVLDVNQVISGIDSMVRRAVGETVEVQVRLRHDVHPVRIDPGALEQVIFNLAVNAKDAMPRGGQLRILTDSATVDEAYAARRRAAVPEGEYTRVVIADDGTGIDPRDIDRIFEPFFTTKGAARGTGLGLATCYGLIKQAGGFIWVDSELGAGTRFEVLLPRVEGIAAPREVKAAKPALMGRETILVAEDDIKLRKLTERVLRRYGYRVLTAADGDHALSVADAFEEPIDLLLTDVLMPKMNGRELADRFRARRPNARILYMSGWSAHILERHGLTDDVVRLVPKPFTPNLLGECVRDALDSAV